MIGIYHKNCVDGTMSASILLFKFPNIKLFPLNYNYSEDDLQKIINEMEDGDTVYIVDFSLKNEDDYVKLFQKAKEIINIDHHIGAFEKLQNIANKYSDKFKFVFDNNKSGASLTWQYFYKSDNIPELIKLVEDRDLWKWKYGEKTKYANAYLFMFIDKPNEMMSITDECSVIEKGKVISEYTDFLINKYIEKAKELKLKIGDYIINAYNTNLFQSEIGSILSEEMNSVVALFNIVGDNVIISFRSKDNHNPSALDLAKLLGGGGHRNASGASIKLSEFLNLIALNK